MLFDGRNLAQNGWFVVRSLLPSNKTGKVLEWYLEPNSIPNWIRKPNIGFSQVGYTPNQEKIAVIELDKNDTPLNSAKIFMVNEEGKSIEKYNGEVKVWENILDIITQNLISVRLSKTEYITFSMAIIKPIHSELIKMFMTMYGIRL